MPTPDSLDGDFVFSILRVKVGRAMLSVIHVNDDSKESTQLGHSTLLTNPHNGWWLTCGGHPFSIQEITVAAGWCSHLMRHLRTGAVDLPASKLRQ